MVDHPAPTYKSFGEVIEAFGGPAKYADAVGILTPHAQSMKNRDSIPSAYWRRTIDAADKLKIPGVTDELMIDLAHAKAKFDQRQSAAAHA